MPTLLVMRHAKSRWGLQGESDHERGLTKRGKRSARRVGRHLGCQGPRPDIIVSSTARRARGTARRVVKAAGWARAVEADHRLYDGGVDACLMLVSELFRRGEVALTVGHNPLLEGLVRELTGCSVELITGATACIDLLDEDWLNGRQLGTLQWVLTPHMLP